MEIILQTTSGQASWKPLAHEHKLARLEAALSLLCPCQRGAELCSTDEFSEHPRSGLLDLREVSAELLHRCKVQAHRHLLLPRRVVRLDPPQQVLLRRLALQLRGLPRFVLD